MSRSRLAASRPGVTCRATTSSCRSRWVIVVRVARSACSRWASAERSSCSAVSASASTAWADPFGSGVRLAGRGVVGEVGRDDVEGVALPPAGAGHVRPGGGRPRAVDGASGASASARRSGVRDNRPRDQRQGRAPTSSRATRVRRPGADRLTSWKQRQRGAVLRTDDREVSAVQGGHLDHLEPLGQGDHTGVATAERQ